MNHPRSPNGDGGVDPSFLGELYKGRFDDAERRKRRELWGVLCDRFLSRYVGEHETVLDFGAGLCDFINQIRCARRFAIDLEPSLADHAAPGVTAIVGDGTRLDALGLPPLDVVFASNVLEHVTSKRALIDIVDQIFGALAPGGRLLIMQPNLRYLGGEYWDFLDHHIPLTHVTVVELLTLAGFVVEEVRPRFMPYTTKSRIPQHPWLVRLYLKVPLAQRLLGKQMFVVARKP